MAVTNPSVIHDYSYNNYFVDHIYATDSETLQQHWIEAGWAEVSWLVDTQYVFTYDSTNQTWYFYSSMLNPLYVRLVASGTTWYAQEWLGTYWSQLGWGVDLGYSQAVIMYSGGEVYHTAYGNHPSLPSTNTDISQLYISGNWVNWDTQFSSTTSVKILPTGATQYGLTTYTSYYNFSIYSN